MEPPVGSFLERRERKSWIIKNYRRLSERQKGRIEGYIKALLDQTGRNDFQSE